MRTRKRCSPPPTPKFLDRLRKWFKATKLSNLKCVTKIKVAEKKVNFELHVGNFCLKRANDCGP